jgi:hypothetical protein
MLIVQCRCANRLHCRTFVQPPCITFSAAGTTSDKKITALKSRKLVTKRSNLQAYKRHHVLKVWPKVAKLSDETVAERMRRQCGWWTALAEKNALFHACKMCLKLCRWNKQVLWDGTKCRAMLPDQRCLADMKKCYMEWKVPKADKMDVVADSEYKPQLDDFMDTSLMPLIKLLRLQRTKTQLLVQHFVMYAISGKQQGKTLMIPTGSDSVHAVHIDEYEYNAYTHVVHIDEFEYNVYTHVLFVLNCNYCYYYYCCCCCQYMTTANASLAAFLFVYCAVHLLIVPNVCLLIPLRHLQYH